MPIITKNYGLVAFDLGDVYSAASDRSRFLRIDNQLAFLSDIVTDGKILGWDVVDDSTSSDLTFSVSAGMGLIERFVTRTFSDLNYTMEDNSVVYAYMQRKMNFIGGRSPFSDLGILSYTDSDAPDPPSGLIVVEVLLNSVRLGWSDATEADFDHYNIQRSLDGSAYSLIGTSLLSYYTDVSVADNTVYYYRVFAVDKSGNVSSSSAAVLTTTPADLSAPLNPSFFLVFIGDQQMHFVWNASSDGRATAYELVLQKLNEQQLPVGESLISVFDSNTTDAIVDSLENGALYQITLYAKSIYGVLSPGIVEKKAPKSNRGPLAPFDILAIDAKSLIVEENISINVSWTPNFDPYHSLPEKVLVTLVENGEIESDPISVFVANEITIETYTYNGTKRKIAARTDYIIKIVAVDSDNIASDIAATRIKTRSFVQLSSPSSLYGTYTTSQGIKFLWDNSESVFDHNIVLIEDIDNSGYKSIFLEPTDIGKARSYLIEQSDIALNHTYKISIYAIDEFYNQSLTESVEVAVSSSFDFPDIPVDQYAFSGNGSVVLTWQENIKTMPSFYKIWRSDFNDKTVISSDFILIDTIPSGLTQYIDYTAQEDSRYYYFITTVDVFGRESQNPIDDDYCYYPLVYAFGGDSSTFDAPAILSVSCASEYDVKIIWRQTTGIGDGCEIYRSDGNVYSWEKVGSVNGDINSFIDEDALLETKDYYYLVRRFRNEANIYISTSASSPVDSILLAKISSIGGTLVINESYGNDLLYMKDPLKAYVGEEIEKHVHEIVTQKDLRINLDQYVVITDWATVDNRVYTTSKKITGASSYIVKINNNLTNLLYQVDAPRGQIIFEQSTNYSDIAVTLVGVTETVGNVSKYSVGDFSANQIDGGSFLQNQVPILNHSGRENEELIPLQLRMATNDGFTFYIQQNEIESLYESIGSTVTFYDILSLDGDSSSVRLAAATSSGLMYSENGGQTWTKTAITDRAPHTLYKALGNIDPYTGWHDRYFALCGGSVYASNDGMYWTRTNKIENCSIIRSITQDNYGNVYISTDLGIYLMRSSGFGDYLDWESTGVLSLYSSNCYGLYYSSLRDRVLVSTDIGFFESFDQGESWTEVQEFDDASSVQNFITEGDYVFAITLDAIWRKRLEEKQWTKISFLTEYFSKNIAIYQNRILITTNTGLHLSQEKYNIFSDINIVFDTEYGNIVFSVENSIVTSINVINSFIYIGLEGRLFSGVSLYDVVTIYEQINSITPTLYINREEQFINFFYDSNNNSATFWDIIAERSIVSVANQYKLYRTKNQGWIGQDYNSNVVINKQNQEFIDIAGATGFLVSNAFSDIVFPVFNERNSNSDKANVYLKLFQEKVIEFKELLNSDKGISELTQLKELVNEIVSLYYAIYSQYKNIVRYISNIVFNSINYTIVGFELIPTSLLSQMLPYSQFIDNISSVEISPLNLVDDTNLVQTDVSTGIFLFSSNYSKIESFDVDIYGTAFINDGDYSHIVLDDDFEKVNSGSSSAAFAEIQQVNILKLGNFIEKTWTDEKETLRSLCCNNVLLAPSRQLVNIVPKDKSWYDVLNSTIDYTEEIDCIGDGIDISYPVAVLNVPEKDCVYVCGKNELISVSTEDYTIINILFKQNIETETMSDLIRINDILYLLTRSNLYYSNNYGESWNLHEMRNLPHELLSMSSIGDTLVVGAKEGVFYYNDNTIGWVKSFGFEEVEIVPGDANKDGIVDELDYAIWNVNQTITSGATWEQGDFNGDGAVNNKDLAIYEANYKRVGGSLKLNTRLMFVVSENTLFMIANNILYYTLDGMRWNYGGNFEDVSINDVSAFKTIMILATDKGLRHDNSTFYSGDVKTSLVDLLNDLDLSAQLCCNSVVVNTAENVYFACMSDGSYYVYGDDGYSRKITSKLKTIHKVIYVNDDIWFFGYDKLDVSTLYHPIKLSTGVPF